MEAISSLMEGFIGISSAYNLLIILLGSLFGTVLGALPGLGPSAGIALLLPITFGMNTMSALCLLVGSYMGTMYGGRITAILINTPGDAPAIMTAQDGYPLMKQGKGGLALGISAYSSFIGGFFGLVILIFGAPVVSRIAIKIGAPEYFMIMILGLSTITLLAGKNLNKAICMALIGFTAGMVGSDFVSGYGRFVYTFELIEGIDFVAIIIGLYGLVEVFVNIEELTHLNMGKPSFKVKEFIPSRKDISRVNGSVLRGSVIGTLIGILPGAGGTIATFLSYATEKKVSKNPEEFGDGALEGLAAPEAANNASVPGALIPMLTLGIPGSGGTAVLLGALIMYGLRPGPMLMKESGDLVWATIAGLVIANVFLLLSNVLLIPLFINIIRFIQKYLSAVVTGLCILGAYSLQSNMFNVYMILIFGVFGYFCKKFNFPTGPFILSVVLAPLTESYFRQSIMLSQGNFLVFFQRPISLAICLVIFGVMIYTVIANKRKRMATENKIKKEI